MVVFSVSKKLKFLSFTGANCTLIIMSCAYIARHILMLARKKGEILRGLKICLKIIWKFFFSANKK